MFASLRGARICSDIGGWIVRDRSRRFAWVGVSRRQERHDGSCRWRRTPGGHTNTAAVLGHHALDADVGRALLTFW